MLRVQRIAATLLLAEETFGVDTPFDGVTKLQTIISRAVTEERITWAVEYMFDRACQDKDHQVVYTISLRTLQGSRHDEKRGLVELLNAKHDLKEHIFHYLAKHPCWHLIIRQIFAQALSCHMEYRKRSGSTWRSNWPASAAMAFRAFEVPALYSHILILIGL